MATTMECNARDKYTFASIFYMLHFKPYWYYAKGVLITIPTYFSTKH